MTDSSRYINPYTDYGFKYLFGTEPNKEFTLALVNALLRGKETIKSLTLIPSEQLGLAVGQIAQGTNLTEEEVKDMLS